MLNDKKNANAMKATATITMIIIISKVVGFLREIALTSTFGATMILDAYFTAYTILSIVILLFSAGISSTFVPIYTKARMKEGEKYANQYANNILNLYIIIGILVSILGYVGAPFISGLIWRGDADVLPLITQLVKIMYPSIGFWAISGVLTSLLNARENFIPEQLMGFALSFTVIIACSLKGNIQSVAYATAIAPVIQVVILLPFLRNHFKYQLTLNLKDSNLKRTFWLAIPALVSMAFDELNNVVDKSVASTLPTGAITSINSSFKLISFALGVLVVPLTTVMFSKLSVYASKNNKRGIIDSMKQSTELLAFVIFPVTVIGCVMSHDVIQVIFEHGKFTAADTAATAPVFLFYMIGVFAFGLRNFQSRVFYALQDTKTPLVIGVLAVALNIGLDIVLAKPLGVKGLTLATTLAGYFGATLMLLVLRRKLGRMHLKNTIKQFALTAVASAACLIATYLSRLYLPIGNVFIKLAACSIIGLGGYIIVASLIKIDALHSFKNIFGKKARNS